MTRLEGFGFSGGLLVAKDGKVLVESYHGLANRQERIPASKDTIFGTGSVTKPLTALAVLVLSLTVSCAWKIRSRNTLRMFPKTRRTLQYTTC